MEKKEFQTNGGSDDCDDGFDMITNGVMDFLDTSGESQPLLYRDYVVSSIIAD